jgi:hypothetical protein
MNGFQIPDQLRYDFFFPALEEKVSVPLLTEWTQTFDPNLFPYEVLYYNNIKAYLPWKMPTTTVKILFEMWKPHKEECRLLFAERKPKQTAIHMKSGIAVFLSVLFWMHEQPVDLQSRSEIIPQFSSKPVNTVERLQFILLRPAHYQAFIQLDELFIEIEKQFYKKIAIQKKN